MGSPVGLGPAHLLGVMLLLEMLHALASAESEGLQLISLCTLQSFLMNIDPRPG